MSLLFVVNPEAGKGKAKSLIPLIERTCRENNVEYEIRQTSGPGDGTRIAKWGAENGFKRIVSVGGDGTLNEVVNGMAGGSAALGIIPGGSGNDFIRSIDSHKPLEEVIVDVIKGIPERVDLGLCNGRYFINVGSVGFDAEVVIKTESAKRFFSGKAAYVAALLNTIFTYKGKMIRIEVDGKAIETNTLLIAIANGRYYGGGMIPAPEADIKDGCFDICHIRMVSKLKIFALFPRFMKGKHGSINEVSFYRSKRVKLSSNESLSINIDGEIIKDNTAEFEIIEGAINVIFPRK
ncbi:diacylglycerol/lipid kinase family protein [Fonticella tunisiensis]|uniref:YegS/Rv2252/BmrU family lipid kinase n=1 Tax=Fonticella tunisiensis TaxID=1096341 RepID=A0A4R7KC06_9CLOT|nr:diacylglycerol kinase family protein [Fonticella tunisiensis]TDT51321.1 YegS/Rv2252/BmrU family lipid kinase [Fonticella tunisiensis]